MNLEEQIIVNAGKLHNIDLTELFYADDTLIMASTAAAAETILQHIELEYGKYNMNINHTKCIHFRPNDLEIITYMNGTEVPMEQEALYLGGEIFSNGSYKKEISHRISNTWHTVHKLDLLWKKAPVSMKWKIIVFDVLLSLNYTVWNQCHSQNKIATDWTPFSTEGSEKSYTLSIHIGHTLKMKTSWNLQIPELLLNRINQSSHFLNTWYTDKLNSMVTSLGPKILTL